MKKKSFVNNRVDSINKNHRQNHIQNHVTNMNKNRVTNMNKINKKNLVHMKHHIIKKL